uniref:PHD-type domain-containing protein n=1 Tax=Elaeophora elaphi TaxID=1147741 RepID=A0A158Q814_9BILA
MQNARKQGFPQSQFFYSLLTENSQRPGSIQLPGPRYSCPYSPVCPFNLPTAQILPHGSQRMFLPNSVPHQQPRAPNLVEARCNIHRISNVQLTNSQSGSNLSVAPFGPRVSTNSLIKRFEEAIAQTGRLGVCGRVPVPGSDSNSVLPFSPVTLSIASSSSVTIDTQPSNNSNNPVVCTSASDDRSGVCLNSQVSNFGVTLSVEQNLIISGKCVSEYSGDSICNCSVSSPPPKDPEPAPLKITLSVEKNNDRVVKVNDKTQLDQNKLSGSEQIRAGVEQRVRKSFNLNGSLADSDESRWDDYCYVCQQGCDAKTGSLGCCARCPRVFHNICHIPAIKKQMEKLPDEWACSLCTEAEPLHENTGTMGQRERLLCSKVLLSCYEKHLDVEPFCKPVPRSVVNYHVIIKQPMDFSTIARRLKGKSKDAFTNVTQFIQCMNLVFENCSTFNAVNVFPVLIFWVFNCPHFQPGDEVAKAGRSVYQIYSRAVKKYLPCMKSQVWLYVNIYSENRRAGLIQREQNTQASSSTSRVHETSAEPPTKKLKKEVKSEFNRTT